MADFVFNISLGRVAELYNRVDANDPAASALVVVLVAAADIESDATLRDKETLEAVFAGDTSEATNTGASRKVLTDSDLVAFAADHANDRVDLDIPDLTWTALSDDGGDIAKLLICYDGDTENGDDGDVTPLTAHDFAVSPDGSDVVAQIASAGFYRAQQAA